MIETVNEYDKTWCVFVIIGVRNAFNTAFHELLIKKIKRKKNLQVLAQFHIELPKKYNDSDGR